MRTPILVSSLLALASAPPAPAGLPRTMNFADVTAERVVQTVPETPPNEKEVEVGDIDLDGDLDAAMAVGEGGFGQRRNKLYLNEAGVMTEVSGDPVIPGFADPDVSRNAFLRDYDGDGWLDLVIVNDDNTAGAPGRTRYFANVHPGGVFSHFADQTPRLNGGGGPACGGASLDFDADGDVDLYVGNYPVSSQDTLYANDGAAVFSDVTAAAVPSDDDYTVDVAAGDINGDGWIDLAVSNHFDPTFVYYNHNAGGGDGPGDFDYPGSVQQLATTQLKPALEPADLDGDGRLDLYASNWNGVEDRILVNGGNGADGKAILDQEVPAPAPAGTRESTKAVAADLNGDGRPEVISFSDLGRPAVLRNTSVPGTVSFVDWTPYPAFPDGLLHAGWHAAAFDSDGDGGVDLFLGGRDDDHLFVATDSVELNGEGLGGTLPDFHRLDPLAVTGRVELGAVDTYAADPPAGAALSVVVTSCSDLALVVRDEGGFELAASDREGLGVDEAVSLTAPGGALDLEISVSRACGDADADGDVDQADGRAFRDCVLAGGGAGCEVFDFDLDGELGPRDRKGFEAAFTGEGGTAPALYVLETLSR